MFFKMIQNPWTNLYTGRLCFLNLFNPNPPRMEVRNEFMENLFDQVDDI